MTEPAIEYEYLPVPDPQWTRRAYELQREKRIVARLRGSRLVAEITCPRCGALFSVDRGSRSTYVTEGHLGGGYDGKLVDRPSLPTTAIETVTCDADPITGTPEGKRGCGATFTIHARVQG